MKSGDPSYASPPSLPPRWCPWDFFRPFKVCSDAKERVGCWKQREATAHIQSLVKLQPRFLRLQWRICPWVEHSDDDYLYTYHHQSILPKCSSSTANSGTKAAVLPKGRSSAANSGTKVAVLLGINKCGSFPFFPHLTLSLTSEQTLKDLKKSQGPQREGEESGFD